MNSKALILALAVAGQASVAVAGDDRSELVARGEYLAGIMDCAGCHMPRGADGAPIVDAGLSGGNIGFEIPGLGTFWPPNLTPAASALGGWSAEEIATAIRTGVRPDGRGLVPVMPWPNYAALTDADMAALVAYLQSLDPVETPVLLPIAPGDAAPAPFYRVTLP